jgi:ABC-2 type transport system permease protein
VERGSPGLIATKAAAVIRKDALSALRYRHGFVFAVVSPAIQLAVFYYLARAVGAQFRPDGMPYFLFLAVGTGFYTFLLSGTHAFLRIIQESQQTGTLEALMTTSTPPATLISLSTISAFGGSFAQLLVYLGAGIVLYSPFTRVHFFAAALIFVFSVVICSAIGLFAAGVQIAVHKGSAVLWCLSSTAWLMAGTMFPVAALPHPARIISTLLPFTHSLTAMRMALIQTTYPAALGREICILFAYAAVLLPAGIVFFSCTVQRARRLGTLSFY